MGGATASAPDPSVTPSPAVSSGPDSSASDPAANGTGGSPSSLPSTGPLPSSEAPSASPLPSPTATGPVPSPAAAPPSNPQGESSIPDPGAPWTPILTQSFDTPAALGQFASVYPGYSGYDGGRDTSRNLGRALSQQGTYSSDTTTTAHDGLFDCLLHTDGGTPQVCALTPQLGAVPWTGQMYGRYSVRFKVDNTPGYKIAWLLWPQSDQWSDGEIDFPEADLNSTITGTSHDVTGTPSRNAWWLDTGTAVSGSWHTATIEWVPGKLTYVLDGKSWSTTSPDALPTQPMRWVLQAETQLSAQAPSPSASGHILIDWIAAYRYAP